MASSSVPPATAPAAAGGPGPGFGFASKAKKKAAHAAKTVKHGAGAEISTVHPEQYAKRFLDFIANIFA